MTPHIDLHTHLNMTSACLHTHTHSHTYPSEPWYWICAFTSDGSIPSSKRTHICPNVKGPCVSISSSDGVCFSSTHHLSHLFQYAFPLETSTLSDPFHHHITLPMLPASSGTRAVTPSPGHHKQRCEGMEQYVQEEHIHPSSLSLTVTVNSWQSVPLGCPCRVPQWGYLTIKIRDTATLEIGS